MAELTLFTTGDHPLKPLVEAALANELRLLEAAVGRTEQRLHEFEAQYHLSTGEFIRRYEADELEESLDLAEWVGEHRLLQRLREKVDTLREIRFAH